MIFLEQGLYWQMKLSCFSPIPVGQITSQTYYPCFSLSIYRELSNALHLLAWLKLEEQGIHLTLFTYRNDCDFSERLCECAAMWMCKLDFCGVFSITNKNSELSDYFSCGSAAHELSSYFHLLIMTAQRIAGIGICQSKNLQELAGYLMHSRSATDANPKQADR